MESPGGSRWRSGQACGRAALVDPIEALVMPIEALVDPIEALVRPIEALVRPIEALVRPIEALARANRSTGQAYRSTGQGHRVAGPTYHARSLLATRVCGVRLAALGLLFQPGWALAKGALRALCTTAH